MGDTDTVVRRRPDCAWQHVNDKVVVVTAATRRVHILHGSGQALWEFLARPRRVDECAVFLQQAYEVDADEARADVVDFFASLERERIIERVGQDARKRA